MNLRRSSGRGTRRRLAAHGLLFAALLLSVAALPISRAAEPDLRGSLLRVDLPVSPARVTLITIDALRADFLSYAGHARPTSPFLDSLAASGVVFTDATASSSWTTPSLASLMTSLEPSAHGLVRAALDPRTGKQLNQLALAPSLVTLAETFSRAGWLTFGVPANLHLRQGSGFEQGFDCYHGEATFQDCGPLNRTVLAQIRAHPRVGGLDRWRDRRAFLWVHYFDPHDTYQPREPWIDLFAPDWRKNRSLYPTGLMMVKLRSKYPVPDPGTLQRLRSLYESEIRATDEGLRMLCRDLGLADEDALLIVTADHGEEFGDHGGLGHMTTLHREQVHVPLLLHWPRVLRPGRVETPVSLLDLYPTLVELLGLPDPGALRGESLVPLLERKTKAAPRPFVAELNLDGRRLTSIRWGDWRLIWDSGAAGVGKLYELSRDPTESTDLSRQRPDVALALSDSLARWRAGLPPLPVDLKDSPAMDAELIERLRSLGYIR